ncbi:hypothetical protein BofuT4_P146620.1 [Botrytis cinerea T4]|uniref:Uncharacterized protein n=1 Tax=Botryotinia fuckeliana (strain T4) TaxID=999810 RepID=G2YXZ5_BOTF4|nr:hypothetical protein BofuT4_P146620.1 [Botrytis cinerea T4]
MSTGLLPAPPGITPNFSTSALSSTQVAYIIAYTITLGLASSTLGIRLYTRISIMNSFGLDDSMRYGFGRHLWEVTGEQMAHYLTVSPRFSINTPSFTHRPRNSALW